MKIENKSNIEEILMELFFKFRDAYIKREYLSIEEREKDRKKLNELYQSFETMHQKILDSKCYLELGKIQQEQTNRFLADDIHPQQRVEMLAYILRSLMHPVLFIHGKTTLFSSALEEKKNQAGSIEILPSEEGNNQNIQQPEECHPVSFGAEDMAKLTQGIKNLIQQYKAFPKWQKKMDLHQAELLSQMVANGELEIVFPTKKKELSGVNTSIILKETMCQT